MIFEYDLFKKWLESFKPDAIVGIATNACNCPAACYLAFQNPSVDITIHIDHDDILVYENGAFDAPYERHSTPDWASRFIGLIDESTGDKEIPVTAQDALECLRLVEAGDDV